VCQQWQKVVIPFSKGKIKLKQMSNLCYRLLNQHMVHIFLDIFRRWFLYKRFEKSQSCWIFEYHQAVLYCSFYWILLRILCHLSRHLTLIIIWIWSYAFMWHHMELLVLSDHWACCVFMFQLMQDWENSGMAKHYTQLHFIPKKRCKKVLMHFQ